MFCSEDHLSLLSRCLLCRCIMGCFVNKSSHVCFVLTEQFNSAIHIYSNISIHTQNNRLLIYVTLDHKLWIRCPLMYGLLGYRTFGWDTTFWKSRIWGCKKNLNIEKIVFNVVQMKFLAINITFQKFRFDIYIVGHLQNVFMEHDLYLIS